MPQAPYPGPNNDMVSASLREVYHGNDIASMAAYPRAPGGPWHPKVIYL